MYELALFAGTGSLSLGLQRAGIHTACYVERDPYRVKVLVQRIKDGWLDDAPIWDDVQTFDGRTWRGKVDVISAGFPCQPFSSAGHMRREQDERYLWPAILQIIRDVHPQFILLENVYGLLCSNRKEYKPAGIRAILQDLAERGYDAEWQMLRACDFGAEHIRKRVFILAYADKDRREGILRHQLQYRSQEDQQKGVISSNSLQVRPRSGNSRQFGEVHRIEGTQQEANALVTVWDRLSQLEQRLGQPSVRGIDDGTPCRVDRLAAAGEAIYLPIAEHIGRCLCLLT